MLLRQFSSGASDHSPVHWHVRTQSEANSVILDRLRVCANGNIA
eukprot:SAG11_NODE_13438_length_655_cov_1.041367_2_plen_43_part_01